MNDVSYSEIHHSAFTIHNSKGRLTPFARAYRSARIARVAATVYARYKIPDLFDWVRGRRNGRKPRRNDVHRRNAQLIFDTAVSLRGLLIKMCQVIGTRSDIFPPEYVKILSRELGVFMVSLDGSDRRYPLLLQEN